MVVGCQPYAPAAFTPRKYCWYSFLLEAESTPGLYCNRRSFVSIKNPLTPAGIEPATFWFVAQHLNHCATAFRNPGKSKTVIFTRARVNNPLGYSLGDQKILEMDSCKYLETILRNDLNWVDQVNYIVQNSCKLLYFVMRVLKKKRK